MCPTELFFDQKEDKSYIRLLPIETRLGGSSISSFKKIPDHWVYVPLNPDDPKTLKKAFSEVASTKAVKKEDAASMGFQLDILEPVEGDHERVYVPAWRHALISFDHPLLRQGMTLIDTPGLNALGCEPELTFRLLPEAHAILFLLSASTGVSGTDLEIWNRHIQDLSLQEATGVYAVLNKIDSIWDPLESVSDNEATLLQMRTQCARQLSIAPDEILTVSAKQGLMAKIEAINADAEMSHDGHIWFRGTARQVAKYRDGVSVPTAGLSPVISLLNLRRKGQSPTLNFGILYQNIIKIGKIYARLRTQ